MRHIFDINRFIDNIATFHTSVKELSAECPGLKKKLKTIQDIPDRIESYHEKFNSNKEYIEQKKKQIFHQNTIKKFNPTVKILKRRKIKLNKTVFGSQSNSSFFENNPLTPENPSIPLVPSKFLKPNRPQIMKNHKSVENFRVNSLYNKNKEKNIVRENRIKNEIGKVYRPEYVLSQSSTEKKQLPKICKPLCINTKSNIFFYKK